MHTGDHETLPELDQVGSDEDNSIEIKDALSKFLQKNNLNFSPATRYFFEQAIIEQRPLNGHGNFFNDSEFRRLIADEPQFADLEPEKLRAKLFQKLEASVTKFKLSDWLTD